MLQAGLGIVPFFMPDHHQPRIALAGKSAQNRLIVAKGAVTGQRHELIEQSGDIMLEMRALWMTRDHGLLPRGQLAIDRADLPIDLVLKLGDFGIDIDFTIRRLSQIGDAQFQFRDGFFEFKIARHGWRLVCPARRAKGWRSFTSATRWLDSTWV